MVTTRKMINPTDAFLWAQDSNGNPVALMVDSLGNLRAASSIEDDESIGLNEHVLLSTGSEAVTVTSAVKSLTVPANTKRALIYVGGTADEAVRWRADGVNPTGDIGLTVLVGDYIDLTDLRINYGTFLSNMRFFRRTANTADISMFVVYFN